MSFLNARVTPEPPSSNPAFETELNDSFGQEKEKDNYNNNEGKETSIIDDRGTDECQEGFDGIPEEQLYNASGLLQNEKPSRPGSQSTKRLSWNIEDASPQISKPRYHACDRVILVALCLLCAASVVLTLLMLFGVVGSVNCACTKKTETDTSPSDVVYAKLSKSVKDLKENVSSLKVTSNENAYKNMSQELADIKKYNEKVVKELEEMKEKYERLNAEITGKNLSSGRNKSESLSSQVNTTAVWEAINTYRQEVIQMDQKVNSTAIWEAINTNRQEVSQLDQKFQINTTAIWKAFNTNKQEVIQLGQKVVNISKTKGPRGPPGYNGTQGPPGVTGPPGSPGHNGTQGSSGASNSGGLSLCSYEEVKQSAAASSYVTVVATVTEKSGKKIIGANCGTNDAQVVEFSSTAASDGKRTYKCTCKDTNNRGVVTMDCYIHYWECPS